MSATHIHMADEADAEHCQVCIIAKVFESADAPSVATVVAELSVDFLLPLWQQTIHQKYHFKGYHSTAPPH